MNDDAPAQWASYWMKTAPMPPRPALEGRAEADVAVIGSGIAGLSTAWELARTGRSVIVLEARRTASGVTGHTTGKLTALHSTVYAKLRDTHGEAAAAQYARSHSAALVHVRDTAEALGLDCGLEDRPAFTYCEEEAGVADLRAEAEAARAAGLDASFVTETGLPFPVAGAVKAAGQAQFHPLQYLLGLAADLTARGGRIYEHSRITGLGRGEPHHLTTASGATVTADTVVVATHHPLFDHALLATRLTQHRDLVVAGLLPREADPGGMYITGESGTRSVRTAPFEAGRRLLIVSGEAFTPGSDDDVSVRYRRLKAWTQDRFPGVVITHRWAAQDNSSTDTLPLIGPLPAAGERVYVATGFGGWGMTGGVLSGRLLASIIGGSPEPWAGLYDPGRIGPVVREAAAFLKAQWDVGRHALQDRVRTLGDGTRGPVAGLGPGEGTVVRSGGRPYAVHRDDGGQLHAVSAVCTHMGCLVCFNNAERTWECPCHGSRFAVDGTVLQGPALEDLEPTDPESLR
ncbi:FAD-dependent oxidoreductase [Streptomyces sp. BR123]|uniref:FAD-dependent oxidoreductase n=1 Tax=Streptomyces sp. BR123 TaxID=2749828 RepID=UPI0015C459F8|nr:FAD-dependent oxidoreductase [Streptomyces sp. BR123]NXY94040.1 FAD-dependent oxidoreductase [Streptomyces sp. BR123]